MSRFDYVKYDAHSVGMQETLKSHFESLDRLINGLPNSRYVALCLTCLEMAYAWACKAIRDDQIERESLPK